MNVHNRPIGLFDSGLGGLSVALELRRLLPGEQLLYAADSRYCPYGTRPHGEIRRRSFVMAQALIERDVKLLVVACNTASAVALEELRRHFELPIVGLEPAVKPAVELTRNGKVGVLATPRTAASERLRCLIERHAARVEVTIVPAPGLAELVETGESNQARLVAILRPLVEPLLQRGVDTLVLGCTHYPFLRQAISAVTEGRMRLIDSGDAVARRAKALLTERGALAPVGPTGRIELLTTGEPGRVGEVAARLLSQQVVALPLRETGFPFGSISDQSPAAASSKLSAVWTSSTSAGA